MLPPASTNLALACGVNFITTRGGNGQERKNDRVCESHRGLSVVKLRRVWHKEEWWFSVVDVCAILTASPDAGAYWRKLKQRLNAESGQPVTLCHGFKLTAPDGKQRAALEGLRFKSCINVKF